MNELVTDIREVQTDLSPTNTAFSNMNAFEQAQRMAKALAASTIIPNLYQNNVPNVLIAMEMAQRMNQSPFLIMQEMFLIYGKPVMSSKFIIAVLNSCGLFSKLRFTYDKDKASCFAHAKELATGEVLEGPLVTLEMAAQEGWLGKDGSKWKTMPDLMLAYRAAAFFGRLYAPEFVAGIQLAEEVKDIGPQTDTKTTDDDLETALREDDVPTEEAAQVG